MKGLSRYRKAIWVLASDAFAWVGLAWVPDGHVDRSEWYALLGIVVHVGVTYGLANDETPAAANPPEPAHPALLAQQPSDWTPEEPA